MNNEEMKILEAEARKLDEKMKSLTRPLQEQIDAIDVKLQKQFGITSTAAPVFDQVLRAVKGENWISEYKNTRRGGTIDFKGIDLMQTKASTVTTVSDTVAPQFAPFQYVPGRPVHVRDLLPVGITTSNTIWKPYESATTNGIARVAEGALKPQSDFTPAVEKVDVQKLATWIKFTEEILEDFPQFTSYLTSRWIELLKQAEDNKLLYGSGSNDIKGLMVSGASYVDTLGDSAVDRYMILDAAATQVQAAGFVPNYILLHPTTAMEVRQTRSSDRSFVIDPSKPMVINGAVMIPHAAMTEGDFLVGDFSRGAMLWDRKAARLTMYDANEDDALYNLVLCVIEERLALVTYNSTAFCGGHFASALAQGSA